MSDGDGVVTYCATTHDTRVVAALNAVLGVWPLVDAANAVGVEPGVLVAEVEGWAAAQAMSEDVL